MYHPHVQSAGSYRQASTAAAQAATFAANVTAGNLIVVGIAYYNAVTISVTDSLGNTYTQAIATGSAPGIAIFYAKNVTGGACTVSATPSAAAYMTVCAVEYAASSTAGVDGTNSATTTTSLSSGNVTVTSGTDLLFEAIASTSNIDPAGPDSGYLMEYAIPPSATSQVTAIFASKLVTGTTPATGFCRASCLIAGATFKGVTTSSGGGPTGISAARLIGGI